MTMMASNRQCSMLFLMPIVVAAMQCELAPHPALPSPSSELVSLGFEFWYAVGAEEPTVLDSARTIFEIEQLIHTSIDSEGVWCNEVVMGNVSTDDGDKFKLGVVTFAPGRSDQVVPDELCPEDLTELAPSCVVVKGEMSIISVEIGFLDAAVKATREGIKMAMDTGVGQSAEVPGVSFLSYLGDTREAAFAGAAAGGGVMLFRSIAASRGAVGGFGVLMKIGVPLLIVLIVALALLMIPNKTHGGKSLSDRETMKASNHQGKKKKKVRRLRGTGDHPDSMHQGSYHFTPEGQHYLSTKCSKCMATRQDFYSFQDVSPSNSSQQSNSFWEDGTATLSPRFDNMATILEDQPLDKEIGSPTTPLPIAADLKHVSNRHWGMDVHNCGSATCARCCTGTGRPIFCRVSADGNNDSDNILVDPYLKTSPIHGEV